MVADGAAPARRQVSIPMGKVLLVVAFVAVFLTFGVPRWLAGDQQGTGSPTAAGFTKLCRQHGGTPHAAPTGTAASAQQFCTVRYGATVYRMDAITPSGFDQDTAKFQRQGCEQAQAEQGRRGSFVYHAETGVCEHRP
jgi:hypothetical protein